MKILFILLFKYQLYTKKKKKESDEFFLKNQSFITNALRIPKICIRICHMYVFIVHVCHKLKNAGKKCSECIFKDTNITLDGMSTTFTRKWLFSKLHPRSKVQVFLFLMLVNTLDVFTVLKSAILQV